MFSTSTQRSSWIYKNISEVIQKREEANYRFIAEHSEGMNDDSISKHFLNPTEEKSLRNHYELVLRQFCKKFQPPMPKNVIGCSFHYFKRFYLNNSVMDYHPKDIVVTCVYLACKVEEFIVSIAQFVANVKGDREKATEIILCHELLLMQQLDFDLVVYNPYRPVEGFLIDLKTRYSQIDDPEKFRPAIDEFLELIQFTDIYFLYSPSQIALAAVAYGAVQCRENVDGYLNELLCDGMVDIHTLLRDCIKNMFAMIKNRERAQHDQQRVALEKKLDKCRNQENNPNSLVYKRKLEDSQDDNELEHARKYSKLAEDEERILKEQEENFGIKMLNS